MQLLSVHLQIQQDWSRSTTPSGTIVMEQLDGSAGYAFPEYPGYTKGRDYLLFMRRQVNTSPETASNSLFTRWWGPKDGTA